MARIVINDNLPVNGNFTFNRVPNEDNTAFIIEGVFQTHLYCEDITSLSSFRYKLSGIEVIEEGFGSDDYNIIYKFRCKDVEIRGVVNDGVTYDITPKEMEEIEKEMYKGQHPLFGQIGEVFTKISEKFHTSKEDQKKNTSKSKNKNKKKGE